MRGLLAGIFRDFFQNGTDNPAGLNGQVLQMLSLLQSSFAVRDTARQQRDASVERLRRLLDRIHASWNSELSLAELAKEEYLSPSYLSRFFSKASACFVFTVYQ